MNFMEAVKAMKEGKKVRSDNARVFDKDEDEYLMMGGNTIVDNDHIKYPYDLNDIEATDWEIYKEEDEFYWAGKLTRGTLPLMRGE